MEKLMSILNEPQTTPIDPALRAANMLRNITRQTYQNMIQSFNQGAKLFWDNQQATPEQISSVLGTDAKEIFELHYRLGQLIATVKPEDIVEGSNLVGNFTMNEDGTVTINPS